MSHWLALHLKHLMTEEYAIMHVLTQTVSAYTNNHYSLRTCVFYYPGLPSSGKRDMHQLHMTILVPTNSCSPLPSNCIHLCVCVSSAAFVNNGYVSTFPVTLHALCRLQRLCGSLTNHLMYCRVEQQRMALSWKSLKESWLDMSV